MVSTGDARLDKALWEGDVDTLEELAGCVCCCAEHTFGRGCPAYVWGGCRGQGTAETGTAQEWQRHYERFHGMSEEQFFGS